MEAVPHIRSFFCQACSIPAILRWRPAALTTDRPIVGIEGEFQRG